MRYFLRDLEFGNFFVGKEGVDHLWRPIIEMVKWVWDLNGSFLSRLSPKSIFESRHDLNCNQMPIK
jgi:hypothetical protein